MSRGDITDNDVKCLRIVMISACFIVFCIMAALAAGQYMTNCSEIHQTQKELPPED